MIKIIIGKKPSSLEKTAAEDLKVDLELVLNVDVKISHVSSANLIFQNSDQYILIGTPTTNSIIANLSNAKIIPVTQTTPGKRGGCVYSIQHQDLGSANPILILAGSNDQGAQYAVYDFATKDLKIDPFRFWTGYKPPKLAVLDLKTIPSRIIQPPFVPYLVYFDNDNDELANMTKPYLEFSFEHWQELIKTLVRLKYNGIDIHDHLGRPEFYRRDHYLKLAPNYKVNSTLVEKVIDYAHNRGVMIQISFYLGWNFKPISDKASLNWKKYKDQWLSTWKYYLERTPIGKCDIFLNRPRDQRWDRKYRGKGKPADVFNEAFPEMVRILKCHNPKAIIIADLYSEGRDVYASGFRPKPKEDYIMAWSDDGFGKFEYMPKSLAGYKFGIYMHAGFYLNHVVHDPHPFLLTTEMKKAYLEYGMTHYCLVNGQTFRHFLLNLEICSRISDQPQTFDIDEFLLEWITRYFGTGFKNKIIHIMKLLHTAQLDNYGYIAIMSRVTHTLDHPRLYSWIRFLPKFLTTWLGKKSYMERLQENIALLEQAMAIGNEIQSQIRDQQNFFHDLIILQVRLLLQLNQLAYSIQKWSLSPKNRHLQKKTVDQLKFHTQTRLTGDKNPQWATWYDPKKRRPNGGYPDLEKLKDDNI